MAFCDGNLKSCQTNQDAQWREFKVILDQLWHSVKIVYGSSGPIKMHGDNSVSSFWITHDVQYSMAVMDFCVQYYQAIDRLPFQNHQFPFIIYE